jgi:hypothetical protein
MMEMKQEQRALFLTTPLSTFQKVKDIIERVPAFYKRTYTVEDALSLQFLQTQDFEEVIEEIHQYTTDYPAFEKRFFRWFNMFMVMKFAHYLRDEHGVADVAVVKEGVKVLGYLKRTPEVITSESVLQEFRALKKVKSIDFTL